MQKSATEVARAREILHQLLDRLGLPVYRFAVEAAGENWRILVECEVADGWQGVRIEIRSELLSQAGTGNRQVRDTLAGQLDEALCDCLRVV
jgi:hypothetical protein